MEILIGILLKLKYNKAKWGEYDGVNKIFLVTKIQKKPILFLYVYFF